MGGQRLPSSTRSFSVSDSGESASTGQIPREPARLRGLLTSTLGSPNDVTGSSILNSNGDRRLVMAIPATQIRRGMVIVFEGHPCKVVDFRHHTPGNLRAMVQTKLRNIRTGSSFEHRFRSADTVEAETISASADATAPATRSASRRSPRATSAA